MLFPFRGVRGKGQGVVELGVRRVSGRGRDREDGWHGGDRVRRARGCQRARGARGAPGREGSSQRQTSTGARSRRLANASAKGRAAELAPRARWAARGPRERRRRRWHRAPQDPAILRRGSLRARPGAPLPVPGALAHLVVLGAIPEPVSQAVVEDPPSSRAKKPSAAGKKSGSTRKSSSGMLSRYQKDTQYAQAAHLEGVRQGWPLTRLLDQLPPIPDKDAINMSTARPHLQLYETLVDCGRLHNALELLRALKTAGLNTVGGRVSNKAFLRQCARRSAVAVALDSSHSWTTPTCDSTTCCCRCAPPPRTPGARSPLSS